jgi:hypothetical protein
MTLEIEVVDGSTFEALPGASVAVAGQYLGQADSTGFFNVVAAADDVVTVSYIGYDPFSMKAGQISETGQVQLSRHTSQLPAVLVTPSAGSPGPKNMLPLILVGLGFAILANTKKRRVSGISKDKGAMIAIVALGVGAVYMIAKKKTPTGISPTQAQVNAQYAATQQRTALQQSQTPASLLSQGGSIFKGIASLFGGSSSMPVANPDANFTPVGIDTTQQQFIDPAAEFPTINPAGGMQLSFPDMPATGSMPVDPTINVDGSTIAGIDANQLLVPGLIILGGYFLFKKKKVGAEADYSKYILPVGLVVGGYFVLKNLGLFGGAGAANTKSVQTSDSSGVDAAIAAEKAAGGFTTYSPANYSGLANDIFTKGLIDPIDQDGIQSDIIQANTLLDLLMIKKSFGVRQANTGSWLSWCAAAGINCAALDFDSFVKQALNSAHINTVNNYLSDQNINYRF